MINSRSLDDLDPEVQILAREHVRLCRDKGIELIVTSTYRDFESQDALYAIGRTVDKDRSAVTNARGGQSWHNFRCAYDVVPVIGGKPVWNAKDNVWKEIVIIGKSLGLEAGAEWQHFPDLPHFDFRPRVEGLRINFDEAMARFRQHGTIFTA